MSELRIFPVEGLPEIQPGDDLADMTDLLPTVTDIAGVPVDSDYVVDGRSLRSQLFGRSRDACGFVRTTVLWPFFSWGSGGGVSLGSEGGVMEWGGPIEWRF